MFKIYDQKVREILKRNSPDTDWKKVLAKHREMIAIIQHERLIHLLVTIFVGATMAMTFLVTIMTGKAILLFLDFPLLALFIGYIFHYRYLENTTQGWYKLTDLIKEVWNGG